MSEDIKKSGKPKFTNRGKQNREAQERAEADGRTFDQIYDGFGGSKPSNSSSK